MPAWLVDACSMQLCGNDAKARRHRQRHKAAA
ncbi:MAG TPA: CGNR zinc finger domain-containing protein [Solirubrobacteraceae bacterium]|jgi:predicted RNA-binding Zn ribbon-like protein